MAAADADLVDGQQPQVLERGSTEAFAQGLLEQVLDQVPAHPQVLGHVLDLMLGELHDVAGQPLRVAVLARREADLGLAHRTPCIPGAGLSDRSTPRACRSEGPGTGARARPCG